MSAMVWSSLAARVVSSYLSGCILLGLHVNTRILSSTSGYIHPQALLPFKAGCIPSDGALPCAAWPAEATPSPCWAEAALKLLCSFSVIALACSTFQLEMPLHTNRKPTPRA